MFCVQQNEFNSDILFLENIFLDVLKVYTSGWLKQHAFKKEML